MLLRFDALKQLTHSQLQVKMTLGASDINYHQPQKGYIMKNTIGFIGLGLIGGSIAKSIRHVYSDATIIAYDTNKEALTTAINEHIITSIATDTSTSFSDCDIIFLCAPVHYNIEYLKDLKPVLPSTCILTDVGSVKGDIYQAIIDTGLERQYVGGHPMVGSERSGFEASSHHLIENAYYFITPSNTVSATMVSTLENFLQSLGAMTICYSPDEHDKATAYISHIPHVIASSLVNLVASQDSNGMLKELAAGGFKDITRIASSSPLVWEHILLSNPAYVTSGLRSYIGLLQNVIQAIETNDGPAIHKFFDSARTYRDSVPNAPTGVIRSVYELFVDIPDEVGTLEQVVSLLSGHNINLNNFGIVHNREDREGALRITFYHDADCQQALALLTENNYTVYDK